MTRQRRTFTLEFKLQLVKLYENGKSRADIARKYDITPSALDCWIKNHKETGSFTAKDNRTEEENDSLTELISILLNSSPSNLMIMLIGLITFEFTEH